MINDTRFDLEPEKTLEQWIVDTIAPINDVMYSVASQINHALNEVRTNVS